MLSHLRFHRRGPSNPSSPIPDQLSPWDQAEHAHAVQEGPSSVLPPLNRVTFPEHEASAEKRDPDQSIPNDAVLPPTKSPHQAGEKTFMGSLALRNYRRGREAARPELSSGPTQGAPEIHAPRDRPFPPPINTNLPPTRPAPVPVKEQVESAKLLNSPADLQNNVKATGKRPTGTRLTSEPPMLACSQQSPEAQKGKKSLPFLKNSMSTLLMRRKASQNVPDVRPLPLQQKPDESQYQPIRGTRVHDFSAPRPRRTLTGDIKSSSPVLAKPYADLAATRSQLPPPVLRETVDFPQRTQIGRSNTVLSDDTIVEPLDDDPQQPFESVPSRYSTQEPRRVPLEDRPNETNPVPSTSYNDDVVSSTHNASTKSQSIPADEMSAMAKSNTSTRTTRSRHISLSEGSALPKHMKSTSSRFSFDMIGAARAEKLLEERHRQKELEKQATDPSPTYRDSRFDDFDEDAFDYDVMMDDDGLEERIPGVNADYDQEDYFFEKDVNTQDDLVQDETYDEDDPDNDQENFAGFVFSRSDPQSSAASPGIAMLGTPRDVGGEAIGFAMTKDTTPDLRATPSPLQQVDSTSKEAKDDDQVAGLGIQGFDASQKMHYDPTVFQERRNMHIDDGSANPDKELYFDEGLLEELAMEADEIQQSTFDESIFDDNDTDQYGRPIPGAFAQAQAMRTTQPDQDQDQEQSLDQRKDQSHDQGRDHDKHESDITPRSPMQSAGSASTAHTSISLALHNFSSTTEKERETSGSPERESEAVVLPSQFSSEDQVAAYQAALAEATHIAAASGKFRRDSSPPLPTDLTITSPTTAGSQPSSGGQQLDPAFNDLDNYEDDGFGDDYGGNGFEDFDFDDEAIIAEANAEALAYDSDGFYGQEFGFYSAPANQGHQSSSLAPSNQSNGAALSKQNLFEYSNGGYFGPSGVVSRTISGRVVSREPNLTPITERSEYSNRNSIMSLLPGNFSDGRNSAALHSPGLAQLAMLADDSDLTLTSLLRLRSKAWGDSQVSLSSSKEGSPGSELAPPGDRMDGGALSPAAWDRMAHLSPAAYHTRKNSAFSLWTTSDAGSGSGSPTMSFSLPNTATVNAIPPQPLFSPPPVPMPLPSPSQCLPVLESEETDETIEEDASLGTTVAFTSSEVMRSSPDHQLIDVDFNFPLSPLPVPLAPTESPPAPPPNTTVSSPVKASDMDNRHKTSANSISYPKEGDSGEACADSRDGKIFE